MWDYYVAIEVEAKQKAKTYEDCLSRARKESDKELRKQKTENCHKNLREGVPNDPASTEGVPNDPASTLVGCLLDEATLWWLLELPNKKEKEDARKYLYMAQAQEVSLHEAGKIAENLDFRANFNELPSSHWLALQVDFELLTPWYSKDDRVFHLLDNPVRKDRVFGIPFMAASSWKGMLRWACRMQADLRKHLEERGNMDEWSDPEWILHLFGNEKGEAEKFSRGALVFYPTWFDRIGFQVINPHSREHRAGTQPIYYEVVPPGAKGTLSLLYAPWPGMEFKANPQEVIPKLLKAIETLLTTYGISAKRTVGWGTAKIERWQAFHKAPKGVEGVERESQETLWQEVQAWFPGGNPS